ncbi:aspartyl protease family protein [Candidatus Bathyarchaeota archaeon]|nr:aspartyl protease family protein [Candidatus Bathyarchaeota archaeon]
MGFTHVKVRIYNPADMSKFDVVELLVDTGAIFTSIPRNVLKKLGLKPLSRRRLRVYGGAMVERDVGVAVLEYEGNRAGAPVIFGEPEDTVLLGATSLEALGYQVDPVTKKLKPTELLMI